MGTRSALEAFYAAVMVRLADGSQHLLNSGVIRAALHASGRKLPIPSCGETALVALVEGVENAGVERLRELGRRDRENNAAVLANRIDAARYRQVERELWGSANRQGEVTLASLALFKLLTDRLTVACVEHEIPAPRAAVESLAVAR
ncbi:MULTISPECIES: hypothetical protein [unclassified Saccharothrix]|uniref:hypothetical protein n=1 Tax=unclassified Saccharothrix TaxID=2593673 RepID=UPI00307DC26E